MLSEKFSFKYSFEKGSFIVARPVFKAVKPNSLDASLKKNFFSISRAIIGSNAIVVFPEPETPTINDASNLLDSGVFIDLPVSPSLHINISQLYGPF